jgi:hypothetical protein
MLLQMVLVKDWLQHINGRCEGLSAAHKWSLWRAGC